MIGNIDEAALAKGPSVHFYDPGSPVWRAIADDAYPLLTELHSCLRKIGPGTYGFNTGHLYDVDNTDPVSLSRALLKGRRMVEQYRDAFAKYHPAFREAFLAATGSLLGIRETRRIHGDYMLSLDDYQAARSFPDGICQTAYGIDVHETKPFDCELTPAMIPMLKERNRKQVRALQRGQSLSVPYRCLTPRGVRNVLMAGRCISTDRATNGTVRIMACCLNTGEAAGIGAALAAAGNADTHAVDTCEVRRLLKQHGAYLS